MMINYKKIFLPVAMLLLTLSIKAQQSVFAPANVSSITTSGNLTYGSTSGLIDGDLNAYNGGDTPASGPVLITIKLKQPAKVLNYKLYFYYYPYYTPNNVSISGSNDGNSWTLLNNKLLSGENLESSFSNANSYTFYQFALNDFSQSAGLWLLNEITAFDDKLSAPILSAIPGNTGNTANLSWSQAIQGTGNSYNYELQRSTDGVNFSNPVIIDVPNTNYIDTTLTQATTYYYRIRARKDVIFSAYSAVVKVKTVSDKLTVAPVLTVAPRVAGSVELSWNAVVKTAGSYEIYRSADNKTFTLLSTIDKSLITYTDVIPDTAATYWYKVRGHNYTSDSQYSNTVAVTDVLGKPQITATAGSVGTKAILSWGPAFGTAGSFDLEKSTDGTSFTLLKTFDKSVTTYTDSTLTSATAYWYRVRARNYKGNSPYSDAVKVTTVNDALTNVPALTATSSTGTQAQLSWSLVFNTLAPGGFELEQSTDGTNFTLFGKFDRSVTSYTMESLTPNTAYWFRIRGYNYVSKTAYSPVAKITTNGLASVPADITDDGGKLYVSAENRNGADGAEGSLKLIDNDIYTKWLVFNTQANGSLSAVYKPTGSYLVNSYTLTTAGDVPGRDPSAWVFSGSIDSLNWVQLDSRSNQLGGFTPRTTTFTYNISNPGTEPYKFYRILFTNNNGANDGVRFQVAEWQIFGNDTNAPDLPADLKVSGATTTSISLAWSKGGQKPVTNFRLQRSIDGIYYTPVATLPATPLTYTDNNLLDSATYYYRIQAIGTSPTSVTGWSNVAKGQTTFTAGNPLIPGNLKASSIGDTNVVLNWTDRSGNETGFKLERSRDGVTFVQIKDIAANTTTFNDVTVFPANVFYYRIRSYNDKANSEYSNVLEVTTTGFNSPPVASAPLIYRKICTGTGDYKFSINSLVPGPAFESSQTMQVTSVKSDDESAKFFSDYTFTPTINNGVAYYGFKTTGLATTKDSATVLITVKDNGGTFNGGSDSTTFAVKFYFVPFTVAIAADKPVVNVPRYTLIKLTASSTAPDGTTYVWSGDGGIEGASNQLILQVRPIKETTYTVVGTTPQGCQSTAKITVSPIDAPVVSNVLSPNGDGRNDKWVIWGIEKNPNNTVTVINRAGTVVFRKKNYANDWDGSYNGSFLPEGAYYYVVDMGDGSKPEKGMLTIVRDH